MKIFCKRCNLELILKLNFFPKKKKNNKICEICFKQLLKEKYSFNKEKISLINKFNRKEIKLSVINYYGGKCELCEKNDPVILSLDHINGNGRKNRKEILKIDSGSKFYKWVFKNKPNNLRLLCYNCNCKKELNIIKLDENKVFNLNKIYKVCKFCGIFFKNKLICNICSNIILKNKRRLDRIKMLDIYGGKCILCGELKKECLTIDHIDNSGADHRRKIGTNICVWLKKQNYPKDNYQLLCYNCNYKKRFKLL